MSTPLFSILIMIMALVASCASNDPTTTNPPNVAVEAIDDSVGATPTSHELTIYGQSSIFRAGEPVPESAPTPTLQIGPSQQYRGDGVGPPAMEVTAGDEISVVEVIGRIDCCGEEPSTPPDGINEASKIDGSNGLTGYTSPSRTALVGVFVDQSSDPAAKTEGSGLGDTESETAVAPKLNEVFHIGDGRTEAGEAQLFEAPPGATRLYVGVADAFAFEGPPGWYVDNTGEFVIVLSRK